MINDCNSISEAIYPLAITSDRYTGVYSHGKFTAWNLEPWEVPTEPFEDDVTCANFWWSDNVPVCGIGDTIEAAIADLYMKIKREDDI